MNNAQGQGQQGAAAAQQQQGQQPLFQPSQIRALTILSEEEKSKYVTGLETLWAKVRNSPPGSPDHRAATEKIFSFSKMLTNKIQQRRFQMEQQRQQQQSQPQGNNQVAQQAQQRAQQQQQPSQQAPQGQQQQPSQPQPQVQTQQPQKSAPGQANALQQQPQNAQQQQAGAQAQKIPDQIAQHLRQISIKLPPGYADKPAAESTKYTQELRSRYGRSLMAMETSKNKIRAIERQVAQRQQMGNPFSDDDLKKINEQKAIQMKTYSESQKWVQEFRKNHVQGSPANDLGQGVASEAPKVDVTTAPTQQAKPQGNGQPGPVPANAAAEAAKSQQQLAAAAAASRVSPANGSVGAGQQQQPGQPQPQVLPPNVTNSQQVNQQNSTPTIKQEPGVAPARMAPQNQRVQQQQPPQPNRAGGSATAASAPTGILTHSAAMEMANQRATGGTPNGLNPQRPQQQAVSTPTSAGGAVNQGQNQLPRPQVQQMPQVQQQQFHPQAGNQQQHGHPHAHPTQQPPIQAKMPIPKSLPEKATAIPTGVAIGGGVNTGRPTMSQGSGTLGGVMNNPAVNRVPSYNHEAEGDHVLSKKKLDELVRQVCGGSSESQDGNLLTPEVEESVLTMADSFVDNVLAAACRNARERGSKVLEIRDIQLVLERTYNIRVPGYSSDELRTVRKIAPAAGWIAKMSAVQAAKVMPGKGE